MRLREDSGNSAEMQPDRFDDAAKLDRSDGGAWEERSEEKVIPRADHGEPIAAVQVLYEVERPEACAENNKLETRICHDRVIRSTGSWSLPRALHSWTPSDIPGDPASRIRTQSA